MQSKTSVPVTIVMHMVAFITMGYSRQLDPTAEHELFSIIGDGIMSQSFAFRQQKLNQQVDSVRIEELTDEFKQYVLSLRRTIGSLKKQRSKCLGTVDETQEIDDVSIPGDAIVSKDRLECQTFTRGPDRDFSESRPFLPTISLSREQVTRLFGYPQSTIVLKLFVFILSLLVMSISVATCCRHMDKNVVFKCVARKNMDVATNPTLCSSVSGTTSDVSPCRYPGNDNPEDNKDCTS